MTQSFSHTSAQTHEFNDMVFDMVLARETAQKENCLEKSIIDVGLVAMGGVFAAGCLTGVDDPVPRVLLSAIGLSFMYFFGKTLVERNHPKTKESFDPGVTARALDEQIYELTHAHSRYQDGRAWKYADTPENVADRADHIARRRGRLMPS